MLPRDEPLEEAEADQAGIDAELISENFHGDDLADPDLPADGADLRDAARATGILGSRPEAARAARLASAAESTAAEGCAYQEAIVVDEILSHDVALSMGLGESGEHADLAEYMPIQS